MKLSELILAVGDDNVMLQNLDQCAISLDYSAKLGGTKITFVTSMALLPTGTERVGLVIWLDREAVAKARASKESESPPHPETSTGPAVGNEFPNNETASTGSDSHG